MRVKGHGLWDKKFGPKVCVRGDNGYNKYLNTFVVACQCGQVFAGQRLYQAMASLTLHKAAERDFPETL